LSLMPVLALGVSYRRAPVELLERLAFGQEDLPKAFRRLLDLEAVAEGAILSTCNRVEVYASVESYHAGFLDLKRFLAESREVAPEEFADPLYAHYEDDAAEHLFSVAAGIDSMVLGEPQILAQVRQAYRAAEAESAAGPALSALFRASIRAGRRARAETAIGASPAAMVGAGADLAEGALGGLAGRSVLVVGAGGMAALAVKHLHGRGVGRIQVLNRSVDRADALAARAGAESGSLESLAAAIRSTDLLVSSTGAAGVVIGEGTVREAFDAGPGERSLFILDLAVPRDVDPAVAAIPGVVLADIDDLKESLSGSGATVEEVDRARAIVAEEVGRFAAWRRTAKLAPLIQALRDRGARIQAAEVAKAAPKLSDLSDREWAAVQAMAAGIVAKLLHDPIVRLKEYGATGSESLARALADLFGIERDPGP
jgi:glutamyl-tRNA reductase